MIRPRVALLALVTGALTAGALVAPLDGGAQAAAHQASGKRYTATLSRPYHNTKTRWIPDLHACVKLGISGRLTATWKAVGDLRDGQMEGWVTQPTLRDSTVAMHIYDQCGAGRHPKPVRHAKVTQYWYVASCSLNPGVGASLPPFSLSVQPQFGCRENKVVEESVEDSDQWDFANGAGGVAVHWKGGKRHKVCMKVRVTGEVTVREGASKSRYLTMAHTYCIQPTKQQERTWLGQNQHPVRAVKKVVKGAARHLWQPFVEWGLHLGGNWWMH
jgi:hypothetical protein